MSKEKFYRINDRIKISPIVLIDESGNNLGVVPLFKAKSLCLEKKLDLVEVSPNSRPPICKIMDYGKFRYNQEIKEKKQKHKQKQLKEIRISCGIADHDMDTKSKFVNNFLSAGHKVQIKLEFKRRENNHKEIGYEVLNKFLSKLQNFTVINPPSLDGKFLNCLVEQDNSK